jgi:CheY-like chemotaxis protein
LISTNPTPQQTILCIDDDEAILYYEKTLLERSGYAVITASSAEQGLKFVTMCKCDAVLLNYELPVMNGYEVAFEIKRVRPELMIVMVSGSEVPVHALTMVDAFVPKLDAHRDLLPMIAELCSQARDAERNGLTPRIKNNSFQPSPDRCFEQGPSPRRRWQDREEDS